MSGPSELLNVHEHEINELNAIVSDLNMRYGTTLVYPDSRHQLMEAMEAMVKEAVARFAEVGLKVEVSVGKHFMRKMGIAYNDPDGMLEEPFTFAIVGRYTEFDHELQQREVIDGIADEYWENKKRKWAAEAKLKVDKTAQPHAHGPEGHEH